MTNPADIKPTARGNRLHSVYFLVVEAKLAASCTCCSDLPVVRQPVLIYPFIPVDYTFKAPPNWSPKIMPPINLQVGLASLGVPNINMNMNLPSLSVSVPPPPRINMQVNAPSVGMHLGAPGVSMNVNGPSVGMHVGGPGMNMNVNNGMNMNVNNNYGSPSMNVKMNVPSPAVEMSLRGPPPPSLHLHNSGLGMNVGVSSNMSGGLSGSIHSPTKVGMGANIGGMGVSMNMRPF